MCNKCGVRMDEEEEHNKIKQKQRRMLPSYEHWIIDACLWYVL